MKIVCNKNNLSKALSQAEKSIKSKTNMDILKNFLLEAKENYLSIIGYDLDISIESTFETEVLEEGKILVEAKLLSNVVKKLPEQDIEISTNDKDVVIIKSGKSTFKLKYENADYYPALSTVKDVDMISMDCFSFSKAIRETIFAVSTDVSKPVLTGELIEIKDKKLNVVSIDGYRMAVSTNLESIDMKDTSLIIPGESLKDVLSLLVSSDCVKFEFGFNEKHTIFKIGNTTVITRLLDGEFVDYNKLLSEGNTTVKINRRELVDAIERASLIKEDRNNLIRLSIRENFLTIASNSDIGDCVEEVNMSLVGDILDIGFNSKYLLEGLKAIDSDEVEMEFSTNVRPCTIKPILNESKKTSDYLYLLLPVRIASGVKA